MSDPHYGERHAEIAARARDFGERHLRASAPVEDDPAGRSAEMMTRLAEAGLLQAVVPPRFGSADARSIAVLRERLAYYSLAAESVFAAHGHAAHLVGAGGSEGQRARWMPALAAGTSLGALAVTEPEAGSDVGGIRTTAVPEGALWRLDGEKTWVTAAARTRLVVVLARSAGATTGTQGLSLFLVDGEAPGLSWRPLETSAGLPVADVRLEGAHGLLLGKDGGGAAALEPVLALFRPGAAADACGLGARARDEAVRHALARRQFGRALAAFQATKLAIAEMTAELLAAQRLALHAAWLADTGAKDAARQAAAARVVATETAVRVVDAALRVHGAAGLVRGSTVERLSREARALRLREGTNELLKMDLAQSILEESR
jgi:alkylation response protein AidB-like acyl-CoA dehydrogenase